MHNVGICSCTNKEEDCWGNQLVYRVQASAMLVYLILIILVVSGCGSGAAHAYPVMKFFVVVVFALVFMFLPNMIFSGFGAFSDVASAIFLVVQTVPLIDFAYTWNEKWSNNARQIQVTTYNLTRYNKWHYAILIASALLLIGAMVGASLFYSFWPDEWWLITLAMILSTVFLIISITEWCKHGSLLTSSVFMAYSVWLTYEAINMSPDSVGDTTLHGMMKWMGLAICAFSLVLFAVLPSLGGSNNDREQAPPHVEADVPTEKDDRANPLAERDAHAESSDSTVSTKPFVMQCAVHAAATVYVSAVLAPFANSAMFYSSSAALVLALFLYGWSLVAPQVLRNREF